MQIGTLNIETKSLLSSWIKEVQDDGYTSVMFAHLGTLDQDLVNSVTTNIEEMMISAGERKTIIKRVFSILIEGLQNILIHGENWEDDQLALLIVAYNESGYRIVLGNIAKQQDQLKLITYLERLNGMSDEEVKAFYLETLNNGLISSKGGAGLGFITMRMKSKEQLDYRFDNWMNELNFFSISSYLSKGE